MNAAKCFAVMAPAALAGLALGGGASFALNLAPSSALAWLLLGAGVLVAVAVGTLVLHREAAAPPRPVQAAPAAGENLRRLRHDLRGALSPALLTADRLLTHADPTVQRAGDIMVRAVDRAVALLADPIPPDRS